MQISNFRFLVGIYMLKRIKSVFRLNKKHFSKLTQQTQKRSIFSTHVAQKHFSLGKSLACTLSCTSRFNEDTKVSEEAALALNTSCNRAKTGHILFVSLKQMQMRVLSAGGACALWISQLQLKRALCRLTFSSKLPDWEMSSQGFFILLKKWGLWLSRVKTTLFFRVAGDKFTVMFHFAAMAKPYPVSVITQTMTTQNWHSVNMSRFSGSIAVLKVSLL